MNFTDKLRITVNRTYTSPTLKKHENGFYCNKWWCHEGNLVTIPLSEIKSKVKSVQLTVTHRRIEYEILERGYNYNMGYIVVNRNNQIMDGYHRYHILKKHFDDTLQITIIRLPEVGNIFPIFISKMFVFHIISKIYSRFFIKKGKGRTIELEI